MNGAHWTYPVTSPAFPLHRLRRAAHANLPGGLVLILAWTLLWGTFLLDVARPARGAGPLVVSAPSSTQVSALEAAPRPCSL